MRALTETHRGAGEELTFICGKQDEAGHESRGFQESFLEERGREDGQRGREGGLRGREHRERERGREGGVSAKTL